MKPNKMTMVNNNKERKCKVCERIIKGRSDKKFCDVYCRALHNNSQNAPVNNLIRNVNHALSKNRRILERILAGNKTVKKITREKLLDAGFQFRYLTHTFTNKRRGMYYFCYEYGYLPLENDCFLIVKKPEE